MTETPPRISAVLCMKTRGVRVSFLRVTVIPIFERGRSIERTRQRHLPRCEDCRSVGRSDRYRN